MVSQKITNCQKNLRSVTNLSGIPISPAGFHAITSLHMRVITVDRDLSSASSIILEVTNRLAALLATPCFGHAASVLPLK